MTTRYNKKRFNLSSLFKRLAALIVPSGRAQAPSMRAQVDKSHRRKRTIRIKNKRRVVITITSIAAAVLIIVVLVVSLTGNNLQVASADAPLPKHNPLPIPSYTPVSTVVSFSVARPVHSSLSLSRGMTTSAIADVQTRLMELEYMDHDEADGIFGRVTEEAVNLFKNQHGLAVDGVVDQDMFDLLFSSKAQYYTITIGAKNPDVKELQQRLNELDYITEVDGTFGEKTEEAVKRFQERNKLTVDGKVGRKTRERLYSENAVANVFSYGDNSDEIKKFQKRLIKLGYLDGEPDGDFGSKTKDAVRRFQEANGLIADGHIGPQTKAALNSPNAQSNALSIGAKGPQVQQIQTRLKELGYMKSVTGYFGSETDTAVRSFQHNNKLTVDGKVGKNTLEKLNSSSAKKFEGIIKTGSNIESFINKAESKLGSKYVRGAKGPNSFDCSGFVYWCLNEIGVKQGYLTSEGWASSTKYTRITRMSDLKRGDILVVTGHVAIVAGNGYIIDASASNGKVVKRKYDSGWWERNFKCGIRIF